MTNVIESTVQATYTAVEAKLKEVQGNKSSILGLEATLSDFLSKLESQAVAEGVAIKKDLGGIVAKVEGALKSVEEGAEHLLGIHDADGTPAPAVTPAAASTAAPAAPGAPVPPVAAAS